METREERLQELRSKLNNKQAVFVEELVTCDNRARAYKAAYDKDGTMSDDVAKQSACRLFTNVYVSDYYNALREPNEQKQVEKTVMTVEQWDEIVTAMATNTQSDKYNLRGDLSYKEQQKALEMMGRRLALFRDKLEVKQDVSIADILQKARERAKN